MNRAVQVAQLHTQVVQANPGHLHGINWTGLLNPSATSFTLFHVHVFPGRFIMVAWLHLSWALSCCIGEHSLSSILTHVLLEMFCWTPGRCTQRWSISKLGPGTIWRRAQAKSSAAPGKSPKYLQTAGGKPLSPDYRNSWVIDARTLHMRAHELLIKGSKFDNEIDGRAIYTYKLPRRWQDHIGACLGSPQ